MGGVVVVAMPFEYDSSPMSLLPKDWRRYRLWLLLILLTAAFFRLHNLAHIPPGLTHDEADHGVTALEIVGGARDVYFTVGYGREPLYDYATAALMAFVGPTYLAARLTAVFFSLSLIAGMTAWVRRAFDPPTALLTAAGLAVGFWPVMAGRQALRSIALPTLFVLALFLFWRGAERLVIKDLRLNHRFLIIDFLFTGLILGATFYTYIPARILWLLFPALLVYAAWRQRPFLRRVWWRTTLTLLVMFIVASPLLVYLQAHPDTEVRIKELSLPLTAAATGDLDPLLQNAFASLRLFTSRGDSSWRYNIPGRPFLGPVMGGLFYLGIILALWRTIKGQDREARASFLALAWLVAGLSPVLVTGPELSMTQAMGMQPLLYLFPALTLVELGKMAPRRGAATGRLGPERRRDFSLLVGNRPRCLLLILLPLALYGITAVITFRDYFVAWANAPEVRVQYEAAMTAAMDYLNATGGGAAAVSTITPGRYHSPALARMTLHNESVSLRWFDARHSLLLPAADGSIIILPGFTPFSPALADYFETAVLVDSLPLRPTDADRPLDIYQVDGPVMQADWRDQFHMDAGPVHFEDAAVFLGYDLQTPAVKPGELVRVATLWQIKRPSDGAILFTHLLGDNDRPIAQADRLDVPGESWQSGDWFVQLHEFTVPAATAVGRYPLTIGVYTCPNGVPCPNGQRLITSAGSDSLLLTSVSINP